MRQRFSAGSEAHILWGLGIQHPSEVTDLVERLNMAGNPTIDISGIEAAQVRFFFIFLGFQFTVSPLISFGIEAAQVLVILMRSIPHPRKKG